MGCAARPVCLAAGGGHARAGDPAAGPEGRELLSLPPPSLHVRSPDATERRRRVRGQPAPWCGLHRLPEGLSHAHHQRGHCVQATCLCVFVPKAQGGSAAHSAMWHRGLPCGLAGDGLRVTSCDRLRGRACSLVRQAFPSGALSRRPEGRGGEDAAGRACAHLSGRPSPTCCCGTFSVCPGLWVAITAFVGHTDYGPGS